jgi:hypothetical protein
MAEEEIDPIVNLPTPEVVDTYFAVTDENGILLNKVRPENIEGQIPTDKLNIDLSTLNSYNNLQGIPCINNKPLKSGNNSLAELGIQEYLGDSLLGNFINKTKDVNANAFVITDESGKLISAGSANETFINRISTLKDIASNKAAVLGICKDGFVLTDIQITKKDNGVGETGVSSAVETSIDNAIKDLRTEIGTKIESLGTVLNFKETVATVANLPSSANAGDVYNVAETGMNYVYTKDGKWDALGSIYYDDDKKLYSKTGVNLNYKISIEPATYSTEEHIVENNEQKTRTTEYSLLKVRFTKIVSETSVSEPGTLEEGSI